MDIQQQRTIKVLENMIQMVQEDDDYSEIFAEMLEDGLSGLRASDAFGSEGQSDPRGDHREEEYTMQFVQEIDDLKS